MNIIPITWIRFRVKMPEKSTFALSHRCVWGFYRSKKCCLCAGSSCTACWLTAKARMHIFEVAYFFFFLFFLFASYERSNDFPPPMLMLISRNWTELKQKNEKQNKCECRVAVDCCSVAPNNIFLFKNIGQNCTTPSGYSILNKTLTGELAFGSNRFYSGLIKNFENGISKVLIFHKNEKTSLNDVVRFYRSFKDEEPEEWNPIWAQSDASQYWEKNKLHLFRNL